MSGGNPLMIGNRLFIIPILMALLAGSVSAITIKASVDKQTAGPGDPITLSVTVSGQGGTLPDPKLPDLSAFELYSSGRSQNISIVNGAFTSSLDISYILVPKKAGEFIIGPITIQDNSGLAATDPIKIHVVSQGSIAAQPGNRQPQASQTPKPQPPQKSGDFFIDQTVNKTNPYVGEQVTLTFRFYQAVNLWDQPTLEWPKYAGFTVEDLPPNGRYYQAVNGRRYLVTEIKRALFPLSSGKLTIDTPQLTIKADDFGTNFDPFGFFDQNLKDLFKRGQPKILTTNALTLNVKPLPEHGKPSDFAGAVGKFDLKATIDKDSVGVDEPITFKVTLTGTGNIRSIPAVKLPDLPEFRIYDSGSNESVSNSNQTVSGVKTFEQAIIPKTSGVFTLPAVTMSYFDPSSGTYKTVGSAARRIVATGEGLVDVGGAPKNIIGIGKQSLGYIITDFPRSDSRIDLAGSALFWFLQILPVAGIVAAIFYRAHTKKLLSDRGYARRAGAGRRLRSIFKNAATLKAEGDMPGFYSALYGAVVGFVADRLNLEKAGLTIEELRTHPAIPGEIKDELLAFLESCQNARFAPGGAANNHAEGMLDQAGILVNQLEKAL
jgi:hypothetical protein